MASKKLEKLAERCLLTLLRLSYQTMRVIPCSNSEIPSTGVIAVWHDELFAATYTCAHEDKLFMVSPTKDGQILVRFLKKWGYDFIFGSPFKGGKEALQNVVDHCGKKAVIMAVDGSRGPRHVMKAGAVVAALRSGEPIYLLRAKGKGIRLTSWDKLQLLLPFSRIKLELSEPIYVDPESTREEVTAIISSLQERMLQ